MAPSFLFNFFHRPTEISLNKSIFYAIIFSIEKNEK